MAKIKITKAIIPVAGWGTRRLPITKVIEKSMLPVGNRPLVDYSVQELIAGGVTDIYMVISDVEPCQVRQFYQENTALTEYLTERNKTAALETAKTLPDHVNIHYVQQDPSAKYGTAVPIALVAEKFEISEPVLVFMGDDFIWNPEGESATQTLLNAVQNKQEAAILGVEIPRPEVARYGVLAENDGILTNIVEKPTPESAPSNLINVSKYVMTPELINMAVDYVKNHNFSATDQEYLLTDVISEFIQKGGVIRVASTNGQFLDGGTVEGWVHANQIVCGDSCTKNA